MGMSVIAYYINILKNISLLLIEGMLLIKISQGM